MAKALSLRKDRTKGTQRTRKLSTENRTVDAEEMGRNASRGFSRRMNRRC